MISRRNVIIAGGLAAFAGTQIKAASFSTGLRSSGPAPALLDAARRAYQQHADRLQHRDYIGIADFSAASRTPRFHILDVASGRTRSLLVAHGRGSDPDHSGWVERFSNLPGSAASSRGAYLTADIYQGKHGTSRRLIGLDRQNNNAEARAIVVHAAWYVSADMVTQHGKLGRSEGCFAFSDADLKSVLDQLGPGRLIYADKIA